MEKHSLGLDEINNTIPHRGRVECLSACFVQKGATRFELSSDQQTPSFKLYPNVHFLPRIDAENIAINNKVLDLVEEGSENAMRHMTLLSSPLNSGYNYLLKRLMDIVISGFLILTLLSWIVPIIGILIRLDSEGPIFFLQKRNKKDGKIFSCIKFRSMFLNPEADVRATIENDPRITRFGFLLRKYHIDELPQLLNVFKGDMSIIGPRPHMIAENIRYGIFLTDYNSRHQVKPGITGLAQSMGYYGSAARFYQINGRLKLDKMYIQQWSFSLDIRILLKTLRLLLIK